MQSLPWLLPLILLWPILFGLRVLLTARLLSTLRYGLKRLSAGSVEALPDHLKAGAADLLGELRQAGYEPRQAFHYDNEWMPELAEDAIECVRPGDPIRVMVRPYYDPSQSGHFYAVIRTTFESGMELATTSVRALGLVKEPAIVDSETVDKSDLAALLARHGERLAAHVAKGERPLELPADRAVARERDLLLAQARCAEEARDLKADPDGGRVFRLVPLFRNALKIAWSSRRATKKAVKRSAILSARRARALDPQVQLAFDRISFNRMKALRKGRLGMEVKTLVSLVSLAAFAAWLAWISSPAVAVALIAGLVFHEGGHLLAMKLFGFRDTQLVFIPFFGGIAMGLDEDVDLEPWKQLVVLFMGPLPGLILSSVGLAAFWDGPHWLTSSLTTVLILNLFNLLPVLPLDGGQILDTAFAVRFPRFRMAFLILSGVGLIVLGLLLGTVFLLAAVGVLVLIRVPAEARMARVIARVREAQARGPGREGALDSALGAVRDETCWKGTAVNVRFQRVPSIVQAALRPLPKWRTSLAALVMYASPVWVCLPLVLWINAFRGDRIVKEAEARAERAGVVIDQRPAPAVRAPAGKAAQAVVAIEKRMAASIGGTRSAVYFSSQSGRGTNPEIEKAVAELRAVAGESQFAYPGDGDQTQRFAYGYFKVVAMSWFAAVARERLRERQPGEALAVAVDGLRLNRLLAQDINWWGWTTYHTGQDQMLEVCEEIMSTQGILPQGTLATLYGLCDERPLLELAGGPMVAAELRARRRYLTGEYLDDGVPAGWLTRVIGLIGRLDPGAAPRFVKEVDKAIAERQAFRDAESADWSRFRALCSGNDDYALRQLSSEVARLRLARAAIACADYLRRHGKLPGGLAELDGPFWQGTPVNPVTGAALEWDHLGHGDFLAFPETPTDANESYGAPAVLQWRLPATN